MLTLVGCDVDPAQESYTTQALDNHDDVDDGFVSRENLCTLCWTPHYNNHLGCAGPATFVQLCRAQVRDLCVSQCSTACGYAEAIQACTFGQSGG